VGIDFYPGIDECDFFIVSGVHRLEMLSYFACLSVLVNYIVFMTFYPACLSLILELSRTTNIYGNKQSLIARALKEEDHKSNPVVQRVKLIMSAGLMLVHARSRWPFKEDDVENIRPLVAEQHMSLNRTEDAALHEYIMKWVTVSADHIVILILLLALVVKFVFFENKEELAEQLRAHISTETAPSENKNRLFTMPLIRTTFFLSDNPKEEDDAEREDKEVQTDLARSPFGKSLKGSNDTSAKTCRSVEECLRIYNDSNLGGSVLSDDEVILLVKNKHIPGYQIEKAVDDPERGVGIRRKILSVEGKLFDALNDLPYKDYDYAKVMGACCENVIGYMPVPVGFAGPLNLDSRHIYVPMATTEGCLVASTNRGCRALLKCGITSRVVGDGMTRGPVVRFPSIARASEAMAWMKCSQNFETMKEQFDASSRFARLSKLLIRIAGRHLFVRFEAKTGDAMGMNMVSKGTEMSLKYVQKLFPDMEILSLSGNFCTDKKPAAVNWIEGRGKSVVCEAIIPSEIVQKVLKTSTAALVDVNNSKNMIGSAVAGSIGGFNAHAANIVTAIFIATGQDPAQNIGSSNCMTLMEHWGDTGEDLYISCTMPSIEIGTVGGGTVLPAQSSCLEMLNVKGPNPDCPGENASQLARIVCGAVLAGELSLMAALTAGHLVRSHLRHNRSTTTIPEQFSHTTHLTPPCKDF
jgi:hydroxymethylglutaryl-CoA reductase (NADPH)